MYLLWKKEEKYRENEKKKEKEVCGFCLVVRSRSFCGVCVCVCVCVSTCGV